ncbi:ribbon-helix-helix domain-containing protein [Arthrobacter sp. ISL-28]|uniref:ribbon-helix-helix domain-containing protein n=1 Tax=Arthrobacter sp. ISL-28 TaxID=2819108 RepID=UPI002036602F|nr:ribbon-helix-helix domain-containing protein [Arthrobacter sp. ISL-28]
MLAPKRKRTETNPVDLNASPVEPARHSATPESRVELEGEDNGLKSGEQDNQADRSKPVESPGKPTAAKTASSSQNSSQQNGKKPKGSTAKASKTVAGAPRNVGVYLAPDLLLTVKETVHLQRVTYADLLLDAFDALDPDTIAREFLPETVPTASGMPRRTVRRRGSAGIQIQVRLDDEQIAWLDEKVVEFGAPSRSALVSTAFKLHVASQ